MDKTPPFVCLSPHLHLLLVVDDAKQLSRFMAYFSSKLAREVGRLAGWRQKNFGLRYQAIVVSGEDEAHAALRRSQTFDRLQFVIREVLELDPLPCWRDLPEEARRRRSAGLVEDIAAEIAARRKRTGARPLGAAAVLARNPLRQPARRGLWDAYAFFVDAFRQAAEKLRAGDRNVAFPVGSFPPGLPFVGG